MEAHLLRIESVYEENTCTTCGRFGVDQYTSIIDNYIKYKNQLVSFIEIIRITLDYQVLIDLYSSNELVNNHLFILANTRKLFHGDL